jgi:hypothetical protein
MDVMRFERRCNATVKKAIENAGGAWRGASSGSIKRWARVQHGRVVALKW